MAHLAYGLRVNNTILLDCIISDLAEYVATGALAR